MTPAESAQQKDFARAFNGEVVRWSLNYSGLPQDCRALVVAHAAYESGWGLSYAFRHGFNFGNITSGPTWGGQVLVQPNADWEYKAASTSPGPDWADAGHGQWRRRIAQTWRAYANAQEALADYWRVLGWPRYQRARLALTRGDVDGFCRELGPDAGLPYRGGYYTLPTADYTAGLKQRLALVRLYLQPDPAPTPPLPAA